MQAAGQVCFPTPGLGVKWFYLCGTWNVVPWVCGDVSPLFTKRLTGSGSSGKQKWRARKTWGNSSVQRMDLAAQCVCPALCQASRRHWTHLLLLLFSRLVVSNTFQPRELQRTRLPCPSPAPKVWLFFEASDFTFITTATTESQFCFGPAASLFLGLLVVLLLSSPGAFGHLQTWGTHLSVVIPLCPFIQFIRFSQQVYWGGLPFPPPVDHIFSELSAVTLPSWVALTRHDS